MSKIVYNCDFGGFSISETAYNWLLEQDRPTSYPYAHKEFKYFEWRGPRHHPALVACVEALGKEANGPNAKLAIAEIDSSHYKIVEWDGREEIAELDVRSWIDVRDLNYHEEE
jgi:hypothetical protein